MGRRQDINVLGQEPATKRLRLGSEAEFYIEQHLVGWLIGKGGSTLQEFEESFNVQIKVDQSSKASGYSQVQISGGPQELEQARERIESSLSKACNTSSGPFLLDSPPTKPCDSYEELQVKQRYVAWLIGKSGGVVREIEEASGCKVCINQDASSRGYSIARLRGSHSQRLQARQQIEESLGRAAAARQGTPGKTATKLSPGIRTKLALAPLTRPGASHGKRQRRVTVVDEGSSEEDVDGVDLLIGRYDEVESLIHDGHAVFKKTDVSEGPVFLFYWKGRDGWSQPSWWFSDEVGGQSAWAFAEGKGFPPARQGWKVPVPGSPQLAGLRVRLSRLGFASAGAKAARRTRGSRQKSEEAVPWNQSEADSSYSYSSWGKPWGKAEGTAEASSSSDKLWDTLLGWWRGSPGDQQHEIVVDKGKQQVLWCSSMSARLSKKRWTKIRLDGKTAYWGKGEVYADVSELEQHGGNWISWRHESKPSSVWTWERDK